MKIEVASGKYLTDEEIVSYLKHSSLPTLLVEGKDDMSIYRWIEEDCGAIFDIFQCHGRKTLFKVFDRRNEINNVKIAFVADKDTFVFNKVPNKYNDIIFTNGYSIENDLYYGRRIEGLLSHRELLIYQKSIKEYCRYYASQVERVNHAESYNLRILPCKILDENTHELIPSNLGFSFIEPSDEVYNNVVDNYDKLIRGHSLFSLLFRIISKRKKDPKYSHIQLYEMCYRTMRSEIMNLLVHKISSSFI